MAVRLPAASFTMLRNEPDLRDALEFAAFETACHVGEGQDPASVQEMLEGSPYTTVVPLTPTEVIERLFGLLPPNGLDPVPSMAAAVSPGCYDLQMTIGAETLAKLNRIHSLSRDSTGDLDLAKIFERALTVMVEEMERKPRVSRDESR